MSFETVVYDNLTLKLWSIFQETVLARPGPAQGAGVFPRDKIFYNKKFCSLYNRGTTPI